MAIVVPVALPRARVFMMVAESNAVNLTDGLDGLAAGTVMIVMLAYAAIAFRQNRLEVALLAAAIAGACVGFLWYNSYPADIFMGDTGLARARRGDRRARRHHEDRAAAASLIGGIYVAEALSVILQVAVVQADRQAHLPDGAASTTTSR